MRSRPIICLSMKIKKNVGSMGLSLYFSFNSSKSMSGIITGYCDSIVSLTMLDSTAHAVGNIIIRKTANKLPIIILFFIFYLLVNSNILTQFKCFVGDKNMNKSAKPIFLKNSENDIKKDQYLISFSHFLINYLNYKLFYIFLQPFFILFSTVFISFGGVFYIVFI